MIGIWRSEYYVGWFWLALFCFSYKETRRNVIYPLNLFTECRNQFKQSLFFILSFQIVAIALLQEEAFLSSRFASEIDVLIRVKYVIFSDSTLKRTNCTNFIFPVSYILTLYIFFILLTQVKLSTSI